PAVAVAGEIAHRLAVLDGHEADAGIEVGTALAAADLVERRRLELGQVGGGLVENGDLGGRVAAFERSDVHKTSPRCQPAAFSATGATPTRSNESSSCPCSQWSERHTAGMLATETSVAASTATGPVNPRSIEPTHGRTRPRMPLRTKCMPLYMGTSS